MKKILASLLALLFFIPTCDGVWAFSGNQIPFWVSANVTKTEFSPKNTANNINPIGFFCGAQHEHRSPHKDGCGSDNDELDVSVPLRWEESGYTYGQGFTGRAMVDIEKMGDIHKVFPGQSPTASVFDRQSYYNLVGIVKLLN